MDCCSKDLKAFTELSENEDEIKDFSKFSKLPSAVRHALEVQSIKKLFQKKRTCSRQVNKYFSSSSGRKLWRSSLSRNNPDHASYLL